jgi:hypothetical protein
MQIYYNILVLLDLRFLNNYIDLHNLPLKAQIIKQITIKFVKYFYYKYLVKRSVICEFYLH